MIDADAVCAELHKTTEVKQAIRDKWGRAVFGPDGELDRAKLADIVFADSQGLEQLNHVMHPKVISKIEQEVAECGACGGPALCVIDAPLLQESGLERLCDVTAFVECDKATRTRRLTESRGWAPDQVDRREAHQQPLDRKRQTADFVITNTGDLATLREHVEQIAAHLKQTGD